MSGDLQGLELVRAVVDRGEWRRALALLDAMGPDASSAAGLELRALAAYGAGDLEAAVGAWEDRCRLLTADGDSAGAAWAAAMVAMYLLIDTALMAPVRGWLRRAERLLAGSVEAPAAAIVAMVRGYERLFCGDLAASRQHAALAVDLGRRLGVLPAVVVGSVALARADIFDGDPVGGLEQLDEVAAVLMSGEVDPLTTGMMYCELICAAQGLALHDRAAEWTEVMERWRHGAAMGGINGRCRVHRAELLRVSGPCDAAEEEALLACDELRPWMRRELGWPLVELGNVRLRKGDLAGAEEAYLAAHELAWSAQPGLALLRLAQGDVAAAAALIADAIDHPVDLPWKERPPVGDLRNAPLWEAQSEIAAAAGEVAAAVRAADGLARVAAAHPSRWLAASAELAAARASLLARAPADAVVAAGRAVAAWSDLGAPFEAAVARLVLAEAQRALGNEVGARMELEAARGAFVSFGALGRAAQVDALLTGATAGAIGRPSARPGGTTPGTGRSATFRAEGDLRHVGLDGVTVAVRDLKGLRYVARLVSAPGREVHALDLVATDAGVLPSGRSTAEGLRGASSGGMPALDAAAREAYRRRLGEVDEDIEEAARLNDPARLALAERDREYLIAELRRAVGLGGRDRLVADSAERARTSVTRSIRYALDRLAEHHPLVAGHLQRQVRTGTYCCYEPDPLAPVTWET